MSDKNFKVKNGLDANGAVTITQPSTSTVPLTILANTLATGSNLLEVKRPDGTVRFAVGNDGALTVNSNISFNGGSMSMYPGNSGQTALSVFAQTNQSVANLIVKAATNQSGNLQEWRDQNNTVAARIGPDFAFRSIAGGFFGTATGNIVGSNYLGVRGWAEGHIPFVVQGVASQTGDLTRWVDSSANTLAKVDASGSITAVDLTLSGNLTVNGTTTNLNSTNLVIEDKNIIIADVATPTDTTADGAGITIKGATDKTLNWVQSTGYFTSSEPFIINTTSTTRPSLIVKAIASQTSAVQEWQNSSGSSLANIDSSGYFRGPLVEARPTNPGLYGVAIAANASQSGDLFQITDASNNAYTGVSATGKLVTGNTTNASRFTQLTSAALGQLTVYSSTASTIGAVIRRTTSQTADLMQWQDQNGGVLGTINKDGAITLNSSTALGSALNVYTSYSGGTGIIVKGAASQTANLQEWQNSEGTVLTKIDSSGRITSLGGDHYFSSSAAYRPNIHITNTTADSNGSYILFEKSRAGSEVVANDVLGVLNFTGFDTATYAGSAIIYGVAEGTFSPTSRPGKLVFATVPNGSTTMTDRMTIANSGTVTINGFGAATQGLIVKGAASQTANLQQWQTSNGTTLMQVGGGGDLFMSSATRAFFGGSDTAGYVNISTAGNGGRQGLVIKSASSQTANLQEWQNSSGAVLAAINPVGQFFTGSIPFYTIASTTTAASGNGTTATITTTSAHNIAVGDFISVSGITPAGYNGTYLVTAVPTSTQISYANTTTGSQTVAGSILIAAQATITARSNMSVGLTVKAGANAPAQTWQNSLGAQIARVDNTGNIVVAEVIASNLIAPFGYALIGTSYSRFSTAMISVASTTAASQGIIVRGAASQTANLQEWQNSAGTVAASINSGGSLSLNRSLYASASLGVWASVNGDPQGGATGNALTVQTYNTTSKGIVILGQASQSANLQEWQNSAGGVLAYVSNDGTFQNTGDINSGSTIRLGSGASSAGGYPVFAIKNATVAPTSNPTDGGVIYVESGSLKYRGQGGAITTIASSSLDDQEDIENSEVQLIQYGAEGSVLQNLPTRIHPAEQLLKESVLWLDPAHSSAGSQTIQNLGWGGTALNATAGENTSVSTDQPKYLSWEGENYIYATGEAGNFMISSASTSLGMTTSSDLDMRVKVSLDALSGINQMFISTWWYRLHLTSSGYVSLSWHDNTAFNNINSSNLLSSIATVGQEIWIRGTLKLNNGSGVSEVKFYTSINGTTWTQLGTTYNGASTSILGAGGRSLMAEVGSLDGGVASIASGKIYRAQVLQGVDGVVVFDCDTSLVSSGSATTFNALTGHIMTITRSTVGRKMVAVTHPLWLFGTDDYLKIAHNNLLDFATNQPFTIFLSSREFASTAGTTILLSKGGYGVWQGYTITSQNSYTQAYFSGPQANSSYYYSGNLGKSTTSRNYFYGRSTTNTFSYVNNNLIGGSEEVAPQYDTSNNYDFYLGRQVTGAYSNMEVFGVAIWRRALTAAEIATVSRYYEGRAI